MCEAWPLKPVGPRIAELNKSTLPAGLADEQGAFPFYCSSPLVRRIDRAMTSTPSILMGTGGVATVHLGQGSFAYSTDTWAFTVADPFTDLCFLYRQLEHRLPEIDYAGFGGSGLRHLQKDYVRRLALPVPPLPEQALVARVLDVLDTAIHETEAIIAKLKAVKQGLLHDLLTRGIDANGELRPPQAEAPHLYKPSPLGWIPKKWDACELNSLVDPARPVVYGILMPGYGHPGGVPVVKVKDIIDDAIQLDNLLLTNPQIDREYSRSRLRPGDLLFTIRGTVGRMAIVPEQLKDANITQDTARLAIKFSDARFVKACLSMHAAARFVAVNTLGVAVQGINLRDVRRIPLPRPGSDEAREIADRLDGTTQRLAFETRALNKLTLAKSGLMDDLLTGRVRFTPLLTEEPEGSR